MMKLVTAACAAFALAALPVEAEEANKKIEHFVMLLMENRPIDHTFGCMGGEGIIDIDGIEPAGRKLPMDPKDPAKTTTVSCGTANYVCEHGPPNNMWALQSNPADNISFYPYGEFDDKYSYQNGAKENAIMMFNSTQLPIKKAVAQHFAVFNNLHGAVPSMSTPNHLMTHTGTSCGLDDNLDWKTCGGNQSTFPQATIYDSLYESGVSFKMYSNSTTGSCPEAELDGVNRHKENCASHTEFYKSAADGTLPSFSYLEPPGEACDHPCHDIAKGERLLKDIYEALRAGPKWENTMFFVGYDDGGGFYDHVVPPMEGVPNPESPCQIMDGCHKPFDFKRLGIRVTSMIMSPWIPANLAVKKPTKPKPTSQYDLTSGIATAKVLFDLDTFLTKRDAWAGTFDQLMTLDEPRTDCPMHFPEPPPVSSPWTCPGCENGPDELRRLAESDGPEGQHCPAKQQTCEGQGVVSVKQKRNIVSMAPQLNVAVPDFDKMTFDDAEEWLEAHRGKWMAKESLPKLTHEQFMYWTQAGRE